MYSIYSRTQKSAVTWQIIHKHIVADTLHHYYIRCKKSSSAKLFHVQQVCKNYKSDVF